ncbi:MAG: hypothetical protein LBD25_07940, partial [Coriobacteriales bacterium]|nr:hypothetical protein [Coriobacteriales bacterium]
MDVQRETNDKSLTRRTLIKGAAVGATGILGAGLLAACTPEAPSTPTNQSATPPASTESPYTAEVLDPKKKPDVATA